MAFRVWLRACGLRFCRLVCVLSRIGISCLFMDNLSRLSIWVVSFLALTNTAVDIRVQVFVWTCVFTSAYTGVLGRIVTMLSFWGTFVFFGSYFPNIYNFIYFCLFSALSCCCKRVSLEKHIIGSSLPPPHLTQIWASILLSEFNPFVSVVIVSYLDLLLPFYIFPSPFCCVFIFLPFCLWLHTLNFLIFKMHGF